MMQRSYGAFSNFIQMRRERGKKKEICNITCVFSKKALCNKMKNKGHLPSMYYVCLALREVFYTSLANLILMRL